MSLKRIVIHWTGGAYKASSLDREHYHVMVEGDGNVVLGKHKPEANLSTSTPYAAHVRGFNTGSIGVALCAMHGADGWPTMQPGKYPITQKQLDKLAVVLADLCETYGIPVSRETMLTHAEVEEVHGITQRGKWDIRWLPGASKVLDAKYVGDVIRASVEHELSGPAVPAQPPFGPEFWDEFDQVKDAVADLMDSVQAIEGMRR